MATLNLYDGFLSPGRNPHPDDLKDWLEHLWASGSKAWNLPATVGGLANTKPPAQFPPSSPGKFNVSWPHLIYAYLIENTMVYEVFARVLKEFLCGERLGVPTPNAANWLRLTECMFYRHPSASAIHAVESEIRPDHRAVRRNAFFRMFGMDLNHGGAGNQAYAYERPEAANRDFVGVLEEFLREVWIGIVNSTNISGPRPTDDAKIANKVRQLSEMLLLRRYGWNLAREEFFCVSMMAWFEHALASNTDIVTTLRAEAGSPSARLVKIASRVNMPVPRMADEYFQMAVPLSNTLQLIESGQFSNIASAPLFYSDPAMRQDMLTIIDSWSRATGHDIKSTRVQLSKA